MKDPEKGRADSAARSHESYMKDPERDVLTLQHEAAKFMRKTWRRVANETGLAVYYKSKKTAAVICEGIVGAG